MGYPDETASGDATASSNRQSEPPQEFLDITADMSEVELKRSLESMIYTLPATGN